MSITIECPVCGKRGEVEARYAGRHMRCPCGGIVEVVSEVPETRNAADRQPSPVENACSTAEDAAFAAESRAKEPQANMPAENQAPPPVPDTAERAGEKPAPVAEKTPAEKKPAPKKKEKREPMDEQQRERLLVVQVKLRITTTAGDVVEGIIPDESWIEETIVRLRLTRPYTYKNVFEKREETLPRGGMLRIALSAVAVIDRIQ